VFLNKPIDVPMLAKLILSYVGQNNTSAS
jgi:hypothetical protein